MKLFHVSSDSTCDLYKDFVEENEIWFAPLTFTLEQNGKQEEHMDEFSCYGEYLAFYSAVRAGATPKTAMLNYQAHLDHFTKMAKAGVKDVLHFSISSGLARTTEVAKEAAAEVKQEYPEFNAICVDPLTATIGQGMLVMLACELRDEGKTAQEAYEYIMDARLRVQHCIVPNDLFYLKRGGRVSGASAVVGTMLNIKPMLTFDSIGKLQTIEKCRGMKKAFASIVSSIERAPLDKKNKIFVVHTDNEPLANELATLIENTFGVKPEVVIMGPTIGTHVGPGSVSCAWLSTNTRNQLLGL
jgi:DegV family protein with EDD domain